VYEEVHKLLFRYINDGRITGLRVDHPDGLYNPTAYFAKLQETCKQMLLRDNSVTSPTAARAIDKPLYLLIEKILEHGEDLSPTFAVHGTTGYEFMNQLNGVSFYIFTTRLLRQDICQPRTRKRLSIYI
jgi:(1->4)-alpha-D-glucan 1-alpha-D-glucosylmutase